MNAPLKWLHQIVERDPSPLDIPPRPAPVAQDVEFHELANRECTYRVTVGDTTIGFVRWDAQDIWVARTLGSEIDAASIKRFANRASAAAWLQQRLTSGRR
jgi:hypothetical protein